MNFNCNYFRTNYTMFIFNHSTLLKLSLMLLEVSTVLYVFFKLLFVVCFDYYGRHKTNEL